MSIAALAWARKAGPSASRGTREQIAPQQIIPRFRRQARRQRLVTAQTQSKRRIADGPADIDRVAGPRRSTRDETALRRLAERGDGKGQRPRRRHSVSAEQRTAISARVVAQPFGESGEPVIGPVRRQRNGQQKAQGLGAFCGKVREIDPQGFPRDHSWRVFGEKMHAGDERIRRGDHRGEAHGQERRVISEAERRGSGEGREQTGDQFVLGETMRHSRPANSQLLAISPGRNSRARRSSTALIMPDSTGPKKAPATSTYSLMTTRIGTSLRLRSS